MGDLINELLTQLRLLSDFKICTIWNNQLEYVENGQNYSLPSPGAYIELVTEDFGQLSEGFQAVDLKLNIHIIQEFYNSDNIDEDLTIYNLRDSIVKQITLWKTSKSGYFTKISEQQDYDHNNVYHYILTFTTQWVDDTAVIAGSYSVAPTTWTPIL